jgi:hypothetical protein
LRSLEAEVGRLRTRRQRLVARTILFALLLGLIALAFLLLRPGPGQYVPGEKIEGLTSELGRDLPADYPRVAFADVTQEAGIDFVHFHGRRSHQLPEDMGSGAAWGDFDGDGHLDLYAVNTAGPLTFSSEELARSPAHSSLYRNQGNGTFAEVSQTAGVNLRSIGQAAAWGDVDGDGRLDLVVTSYGRNALFRNQGNGAFADLSEESGLAGPEGFWAGASWGDFDRDGDLDLYVCGYVQYRYDPAHLKAQSRQYDALIPASLNPSTYAPQSNLLWRNEGNGAFREVARQAGVNNPEGRSLSASWCDFDADGWPELYVANDLSDNALFHNEGNGTFADISHPAYVADYRGAMGLATGDWEGDGDMDLFVTHWIAQENALYANMQADYRQAGLAPEKTALRFMDVADRFGLGQIALDYIGWGTAFVDYDNDGRPDLLVVNGSTFQREDDPSLLVPMRHLLFWNKSDEEGFFEVGQASGEIFSRPQVGRGLAVGDYDNDGDADAFIVANGGPATLLRNDGGNQNHWLRVRLADCRAQGVHVRAVAGGRAYVRQVGASPSYYSQHAAGEELFGLGSAALVDTLEIVWLHGPRRVLTGLSADQTVVVEQP